MLHYNIYMSIFITRETTMRLLRDIKTILKEPLTDNGIYYFHDDEDMLKGYALIIGPAHTPYFGGYYFFEFTYPYNYPHSPPSVKYYTNGYKNGYNIRIHPNLYRCGKVCISLLNTWKGDQWTSCQTISTILLSLCTLFCENPLLHEPNIHPLDNDINPYNKIIEYYNLNTICDIIFKHPHITIPIFEKFYPIIIENFHKNYNTLIEFAENKYNTEFKNSTWVRTTIYSLLIYIDYKLIINKLIEANLIIHNSFIIIKEN